MNNCNLIGNICKDVEVRIIQGTNKKVIQNTIAVKRNFKNKNGVYDSDFINIVVYEPHANFMEKYIGKGDKVGISGRWQTRTYDGQKGKQYVNELVVESIQLLAKSQNQNNGYGQPSQQPPYQSQQSSYTQETLNNGYDMMGYSQEPQFNNSLDISTDELPFY